MTEETGTRTRIGAVQRVKDDPVSESGYQSDNGRAAPDKLRASSRLPTNEHRQFWREWRQQEGAVKARRTCAVTDNLRAVIDRGRLTQCPPGVRWSEAVQVGHDPPAVEKGVPLEAGIVGPNHLTVVVDA